MVLRVRSSNLYVHLDPTESTEIGHNVAFRIGKMKTGASAGRDEVAGADPVPARRQIISEPYQRLHGVAQNERAGSAPADLAVQRERHLMLPKVGSFQSRNSLSVTTAP